MAVPGSGPISLLGICREKQNDDYTDTTAILGGQGNNPGSISLESCSTSGSNHSPQVVMEATNTESPNFPDGNTSHGMSEFYSYDHDYVPIACNLAMDVVFLLDYTGSMTSYYTTSSIGLKAQVATISNKIVSRSGGDYRLSIVLIDQNSSEPSYWSNSTAASSLASQYRWTSGDIRLTGLVPFANANKTDFDSKMGMLAESTNDASNMLIGTGGGSAEPNDTTIDRVVNNSFVGAFRSGVNKMIILVTDNAPDADGDDIFTGEEEYLKMGTLSNNAVAANMSISVIGDFNDSTSTDGNYTTYQIYNGYADNTGGTANFDNDADDIVTQIDNICDGIETNFATVATVAETSLTSTSFTMNGNITAQGGSSVTTRGFVRATSASSLFIGQGGVTNVTVGSGTGTFSSAVTGLSVSTTYYYKAYAINSTGTSYGAVEQVVTPAVTVVPLYVYTTAVQKKVFACGVATNGTWYFPDVSPAQNDQVYTNSNGTSPPSAGNYGYYSLDDGDEDTNYRFTVDSSGIITEVASC